VCALLQERGMIPVSFDNYATGRRSNVRFGPEEEGDIRDTRRLDALLQHFGSVKGVMATPQDLAKIAGISLQLARTFKRLRSFFNAAQGFFLCLKSCFLFCRDRGLLFLLCLV
jgi:hypothetical protein